MRKLIEVDGTEVDFDTPQMNEAIRALIGAEHLEADGLYIDGIHHTIFYDEEAYTTRMVRIRSNGAIVPHRIALGSKPCNAKATALFHKMDPGISWNVLGDVFICPYSDFGGKHHV